MQEYAACGYMLKISYNFASKSYRHTIGWSNAFSMQFKHGPSKPQEISNYTLMSYTKIMKFVLITRADIVSSSMKLLL